MQLTYDARYNVAYIRLKEPGSEDRVTRVQVARI